MQPPAGAGNVVTVFVPGLAPKFAEPGALTITIPEPPAAPLGTFGDPFGAKAPPPPPLPVLIVPAVAAGPIAPTLIPCPVPPIPEPPAPPLAGPTGAPLQSLAPPPPPPA